MTEMLFHGLPAQVRDSILERGVRSPSYWGTAEVALEYAGEDGLVLAVPVDRFDEDDLQFNDLIAASSFDEGYDDVPVSGDWRGSIREFGSLRYDAVLSVDVDDFITSDELRSQMDGARDVAALRVAR